MKIERRKLDGEQNTFIHLDTDEALSLAKGLITQILEKSPNVGRTGCIGKGGRLTIFVYPPEKAGLSQFEAEPPWR